MIWGTRRPPRALPLAAAALLPLAAALLHGCGGDTSRATGAAASTGGGAGESSPASGGHGGLGGAGTTGGAGTGGGGATPPSSEHCDALAAAIRDEATAQPACSTLVRFDFETLAPLGFSISCDRFIGATEAEAQATAAAATGYDSTLLAGDATGVPFVFYDAPGDFGGTTVVSARTGLAIFGASIVWSGTGEITLPATWRPSAELGLGCTAIAVDPPPPSTSVDLAQGQAAVAPAAFAAALAQSEQTAVASGLLAAHYIFERMVLLYPRTVGAFDPARAEWIVILESGWLE